MYRFLLDIPKYEYDSFVENSEYCNLLQSYDWAKIKSNWQHIHVGVYQEDTLVGVSLILIKQHLLLCFIFQRGQYSIIQTQTF